MGRQLVDFFLLGAAKSGTTTLEAILSSHPKIYTGRIKEPQFFDIHYDEGPTYMERQMAGAPADALRGDCSPQNLNCPWVPSRIEAHCPQAKLLVVVRDPVHRFYSNWWMKHANGSEKRSLTECIDFCLQQHHKYRDSSPLMSDEGPEIWRRYFFSQDTREVDYLPYFEIGLYARHIQGFLRHFRQEQLKTLSFRALISAPQTVYDEVCDFLGLERMVLKDKSPKNQALGPLAATLRRVAEVSGLNRVIPQSVQDQIRAGLQSVGDGPPQMPEEQAKRLMAAYEPYNRDFEELTGKLPE